MLEPPPRDENGQVTEHDHAQIADSQVVIRGITPYHIKEGRISSMAYQASSGEGQGMSIDLKELIEADGKNPVEHILSNPNFVGAVSFNVKDLRDIDYKVGYDPIPETEPNANPYHGQVWGKFPDSKKKKLARMATKFADLEDVTFF